MSLLLQVIHYSCLGREGLGLLLQVYMSLSFVSWYACIPRIVPVLSYIMKNVSFINVLLLQGRIEQFISLMHLI